MADVMDSPVSDRIENVIGPTATFVGELKCDGGVRIDGVFQGSVETMGNIIIGETAEAIRMSKMLLDEGVFVIGFGYPVVPHGTARIRCQISAAHETEHLDAVLDAMKKVGGKLGVV